MSTVSSTASRDQRRTCFDELAKVATQLARDEVGALFAIERRVRLQHIVAQGVALDAAANADLLGSIFWPKSPLHDGGVVLRGDRIVGAGCHFPLGERRDPSSRIGTRHRAALGLSATTDAIVVVVSEETGRVSVAVDGELRPVEHPARLAERLEELMERHEPARPAPAAEEATFDDSPPPSSFMGTADASPDAASGAAVGDTGGAAA